MALHKNPDEAALYLSIESGQGYLTLYNGNFICMRFTMESTTSRDTLTASPLLTPEERLKLWQRFKGMWKNRTPDPVEELERMRKEWDRELPPAG